MYPHMKEFDSEPWLNDNDDFMNASSGTAMDFGTGKTNYSVHKLVAQYFLPMPTKAFCEIHHKDFNGFNNKADNLMWVSTAEHKEIHRQHEQNENIKKTGDK